MQTFLPYPDFAKSAASLDRQRLGKQRVETKQIYLALTQEGYGWANHPATKMWRGYEIQLARYGFYICEEWKKRGYKDTMQEWFNERTFSRVCDWCFPPWFGNEDFHRSHKSNLIRKMPEHYGPMWPDVPRDLPYIWPTL